MMSLLLGKYKYIILILILASGAVSSYFYGFNNGKTKIQSEWDLEKAQVIKAENETLEQAILINKDLQSILEKQKGETNAKINTINKSISNIVVGLSKRPERPSSGSVSNNPGPTNTVCTGAELFRQDSEFLVREAARADKLAVELKQCIYSYNEVKSKINAIGSK